MPNKSTRKADRPNVSATVHPQRGSSRPEPQGVAPDTDPGTRRRVFSQNFFRSASDAGDFTEQLTYHEDARCVVEIGPGSGRITTSLSRLGHPVVAVEIDEHWHDKVKALGLPNVEVQCGDFLEWEPHDDPFVAIGNLPFGTGTDILRRCLEFSPYSLLEAVFLMQQEYVSKRVGRYGGNSFNAQWWPWYTFHEGRAFPRQAFQPVPRADTSTLFVIPREEWEIDWRERRTYQDFVAAVYDTGHADIGTALRKAARGSTSHWLRRAGVPAGALVKQLGPQDWVELYMARNPPPGARTHGGRTQGARGRGGRKRR
ncbi:rRNA adenine N(6)-methyltransferase family protein [Streptomyces sp. NPDC042898]|uniref:23S ribosomal RNA methyltransferase Erm n=1 Tax=unclassified Streptomyces TaxID=2593676 RepID=UPI003333AEDB